MRSPGKGRRSEPGASPLRAAYSGKRVWLSGHTGFKGAWLAAWLLDMGADVHGFSLAPPTTPALFDRLGLKDHLDHEIGDLRDASAVKRSIQAAQPDFVFHLAAQAIVRASFEEPVETYMTNVMGTIHVMEALRTLDKPCSAVLVTSDKCYENREWVHGYREEDPLGGFDPYSSSKAAAEIAIASWRRSFLDRGLVRVASARAGNVIGGGDWARDRILPDCIRALQCARPVPVRNKTATRPWQHALDPLSGYLWLGAVLSGPARAQKLDSAFNFGPGAQSNRTVEELVTEVLKGWPGTWEDKSDPHAVHEAELLQLSVDKAYRLLEWRPVWSFEKAVETAVGWYREAHRLAAERAMLDFTRGQIAEYERDARRDRLPWACGRAPLC